MHGGAVVGANQISLFPGVTIAKFGFELVVKQFSQQLITFIMLHIQDTDDETRINEQ